MRRILSHACVAATARRRNDEISLLARDSVGARPYVPAIDLTSLSDAELTDELTTWAGRVAAGEARLLALIGEFDRRETWSGPGVLSCAHWLSWRLGMGLVAAREAPRSTRPVCVLSYQR